MNNTRPFPQSKTKEGVNEINDKGRESNRGIVS